MKKQIKISEQMLYQTIASVLAENRKVLKVGGQQQASPTSAVPDMSTLPTPDPNIGANNAMPQDGAMAPVDDMSMGGGEPQMQDGANEFDTNFDAGVEADEETDPKRYIQQLTGKLSQSINSFTEENGADAGLCKYVASMIIAATCKNLDEKAKKELIEKINSAENSEDEPSDDMPEPEANEPETSSTQDAQPIQEHIITKQELHELALGMATKKREPETPKIKGKTKSIFSGKSF